MSVPTQFERFVADMRRNAERHLAEFDVKHANAVAFQQQAQRELAAAKVLQNLAAGYAATANALESGVVDANLAGILTELRDGLADAQEAINPRLPFKQQREQLAAANAAPLVKAHDFKIGDAVNVSDPEHEYFGVRATVAVVCDSGWLAIETGRNSTPLALPASSLMQHAEFVARMDAADSATAAAQLKTAAQYWNDAQIGGTACTDCGGPLAGTGGGIVSGETPAGRMFEHIDPQDCIKHAAAMRAGDEAFAAGYIAAVDDARVTAKGRTLVECPTHNAAFYDGGECPVCAMNARAAAAGTTEADR